ncbi:MAG: glycosyltransferase [Alphaproteobacteria bacterium]|nr:glycosyltransferase [Alphaproteobacteria bacterium]
MRPLRVLHLYRPRLPSDRAQSIQVLHTCHALAEAGCEVSLFADAPAAGWSRRALPTPEEVLEWYGLPPSPGLRLALPPSDHPSLQGAWFRAQALRWVAKGGKNSLILARSKKHLRELLRLPGLPRVILEAHEVDSLLALEAGEDPEPARALERATLSGSQGLVCNCQGTLDALEQTWPGQLPALRQVVRNATAPARARLPWAPTQGPRRVGYLGSLGRRKDIATLVEAAHHLPEGCELELLGGSAEDLARHGPLPPRLRHVPPLPYAAVPERISGWSAAVVALDDGVFGRAFCNPLKIWDYLAIGLPLVLPELPTMREIVGPDEASWYRPGDAASLSRALAAALSEGRSVRRTRSWADRAQELLAVMDATLAGPGRR